MSCHLTFVTGHLVPSSMLPDFPRAEVVGPLDLPLFIRPKLRKLTLTTVVNSGRHRLQHHAAGC